MLVEVVTLNPAHSKKKQVQQGNPNEPGAAFQGCGVEHSVHHLHISLSFLLQPIRDMSRDARHRPGQQQTRFDKLRVEGVTLKPTAEVKARWRGCQHAEQALPPTVWQGI